MEWMKRAPKILVFAVGLLLLGGPAFSENGIQGFSIGSKGTVQAGGFEFSSLSEYVNSDYFQAEGKRCVIKGRSEPSLRLLMMAVPSDCTTGQTVIQGEYWPAQPYTIPIVFHVISKDDGTGNISDQRIYDQVEVLNEDFRALAGTAGSPGFDTKIQFELAGITRTVNNTWHNDQLESAYKLALGWDRDLYLNVYVNSASGYLGYAYLPQDHAGDNLDGIVVLYSSVGGRDNGFVPYDQGRTLVHEVGHYLGLLHTFDGGGCYEGYQAGDLIADTHSESTAHYGCTETYTCETPDDIHNYLNYTDDPCMHEFTGEQSNRMVCSLVNYRPQMGGSSPTPPSPSPFSPTPTPASVQVLIKDGGDYNGDGTSDIAVFRPGSGLWSVRGITRVYYGTSADLPAPGDYNGDGTTDIAVFRPAPLPGGGSSGLWEVRGVTRAYFGSSTDLPVPGDYNGDGETDIGIFRGSSGLWAVRGVTRAYFGGSGDQPVPGDYNGDGRKNIAVFRSSGLWAIRNLSRIYYGTSGDLGAPGDYDGDGTWDAGIFRPSSGMWGVRGVTRVYFGSSGDIPVPADYDGDLVDDIGIFRDSSGLWAIRGISRVYFGVAGDVPVTR